MPKGIRGSKAPHGTLTRYSSHGCRCEECREASRVWRRQKYGVATRPQSELRSHGWSRYKKGGCRCDVCKAAAAAQKRRQRANNAEKYRLYEQARRARRKADAA